MVGLEVPESEVLSVLNNERDKTVVTVKKSKKDTQSTQQTRFTSEVRKKRKPLEVSDQSSQTPHHDPATPATVSPHVFKRSKRSPAECLNELNVQMRKTCKMCS